MHTLTESYTQQKQRHSKELSDFTGLFFAFSNEQFKQGMEKVGLNANDTSLIVSIGSGGYLLKSKVQEFKDMFKRHNKERKERLKDEKNLIESLAYELNNHEYCITHDPTDALNALGLVDVDKEILKKAIKLANGEN